MEGHGPQQLCVKLVDCVLEEGRKHEKDSANGPLDPKEEGITRAEKIRRMQHQPIAMKFPKSDVQLGKTKVFMRKHPHDCLEAHRVFHQHSSATLIQCWARGLEQQRRYYITQDAVETIQRCYRGHKGRERYVCKRCSQVRVITFSHTTLARFVGGPSFAGRKLGNCSQTSFGCLSSCELSIAPSRDRFVTKLSFADAMYDERLLQSRRKNTTACILHARSS